MITASQLLKVSWRNHTNEELGIGVPVRAPKSAPWRIEYPDEISEADVIQQCKDHFATFGSIEAAAAHYGLSSARLYQITGGIAVGCPRVLGALGIKRERGGIYRRINT